MGSVLISIYDQIGPDTDIDHFYRIATNALAINAQAGCLLSIGKNGNIQDVSCSFGISPDVFKTLVNDLKINSNFTLVSRCIETRKVISANSLHGEIDDVGIKRDFIAEFNLQDVHAIPYSKREVTKYVWILFNLQSQENELRIPGEGNERKIDHIKETIYFISSILESFEANKENVNLIERLQENRNFIRIGISQIIKMIDDEIAHRNSNIPNDFNFNNTIEMYNTTTEMFQDISSQLTEIINASETEIIGGEDTQKIDSNVSNIRIGIDNWLNEAGAETVDVIARTPIIVMITAALSGVGVAPSMALMAALAMYTPKKAKNMISEFLGKKNV